MAVRGCSFCGYQIRYHGEPEGTEPVEHVFCLLDDWRELETKNLTSDYLELEHEEKFFYAWRCVRCNTFMFFNHLLKNIGSYTPIEKFSSEPMQEPFDFGPFWNDFQWFDITEGGIPASEVLTKFPDNLWFAKNDNELRFFSDEARTNCVGQFRRFHRPEVITVQSMSLDSFKKMLANWDDIEFFYHGVYYNFMKESLVGEKIKIDVWRGQNYDNSRYSVTLKDDENFVDDLINAKIFDDGKSIAEAQAEIEL